MPIDFIQNILQAIADGDLVLPEACIDLPQPNHVSDGDNS